MKTLVIILSVVSLAVVYCASAEAATTDRTVAVIAGGTVAASTSMSIDQTSISFGTSVTTDTFPTTPVTKKVVITYTSNYNPWKIDVYTNNTQVPNKVGDLTGYGRYAKGGLATADGKGLVPCKWVAKIGSNTTVPTLPTPASLHNYIKDKRDEDDPATPLPADESWATGFSQGYANIAFGDTTGGYCVDPTNNAPGPNQYKGDAVTGSIAVYIDAMFGTTGAIPAIPAGAGVYSSTISFDLYHE